MDRLDLYRLFVRIAEAGSFTRAAEQVGISRSAASMAIGALEARLATRLLARSTRRVSLTAEGHAFLERCRRVLVEVVEAESLFDPQTGPHGLVRATMPGRLGRRVVAPNLGSFLDQHPRVDVELRLGDGLADLVGEGVDCALRVGDLADSSLTVRRLGVIDIVSVASPAYLAIHGIPAQPRDLAGHHMVRFLSPSTGRAEAFEWQQAGRTQHLAMSGRVLVDTAEAQIACALAAQGIIQIPAYDVRAELGRGDLIEILSAWRPAAWPISLVQAGRGAQPRRVSVFTSWLAALMRQEVTRPGAYISS